MGELRNRWRERAASGDEHATSLAKALERTVVRPLLGGSTEPLPCAGPDSRRAGHDDLELVASAVEELAAAARSDPCPGLVEACAGMVRLAARTGAQPLPDRALEALAALPGGPGGRVVVAEDGPYLAIGAAAAGIVTWLGAPLEAGPVVALCRCGRSASRPWCDGTHADTGFSGDKQAARIVDRPDSYTARQFTVTDNRGLCAHSGHCTDALPAAFRVDAEPFVAPAGGRADDLLRAIQACPSGALGVAVEGRRRAALTDSSRSPSIEVSKDGPYRLVGGIEVVDPAGGAVERPAGFSPEHCSLCRCGASTNKPFCSGAHWNTDFQDPVADDEPTLFAWVGGYPALLRMTRLFYERHVADDDLLAPLFASMEPDHPERVAAWLSEVFGGPGLYSQRYGGYARMISQHIGKHLTESQRSRWVALLVRSADEAGIARDPEFRAAFAAYLEWGTRIAVENSAEGAAPPEGMPIPRWWWVCNATPAARPSSLPTAEPEQDPPPVETPAPGASVGFARHVRGLFRPRDRAAMRSVFDLWSHADVTEHSAAIVDRLRDGSMPCDRGWPPERLAVVERWVDDGCRP